MYDMKYNRTVLPNELRVITVPIPSMESVTVTMWVNTGSRYESKKISGISHFLEHMPAKGTRNLPSAKAVSEAIDSFGAEFNAGTSKEWTNYYIKCRNAKIDTAFNILSEMLLHPLLREEDIEREKGVIIEEIGMYEDTPLMHIGDLFGNLIFEGNPLSRDIYGDRDTVRSIKRDDFLRYRKMHYGSNSIVITVSGGVMPDKVVSLAKERMSKLSPIVRKSPIKFEDNQNKPALILESKESEQAHMIIGFRGHKRGDKTRFAEAILTTILGGGMSSRLFEEVREKRGLAYSVSTSGDHYEDTGYIGTYAGVDPKRIDETIEVILDQHYGLASGKYAISDSELSKAKEYLKGHIALSLEDTRSINQFYGIRELKLGRLESPQDVYQGIDSVTKQEVYKLAEKLFVREKLNLAVIGPYDDEMKFQKIL